MKYAGIDIGSTAIKIVVLDDQAKIRKVYPYKRHFGNVGKIIDDDLGKIASDFGPVHITLTGKIGEYIAEENSIDYENEVLCVQSALNHAKGQVGMIIDIGGQHVKFMSVSNNDGDLRIDGDIKMNSSCAAGTGAFMDQQAERLYGTDADSQGDLSQNDRADLVLKRFINAANRCEKPAKIAGRCSVFAKSDMIHNQQVGVPPEEVSYGLIVGFARNLYGTVTSKMQLKEPVVLIGGVAGNIVVKKTMEHEFKLTQSITIPEHFEFIPAIGAALRSIGKKNNAPMKIRHVHINNRSRKKNPNSILRPLSINLSRIGSNKIVEPYENVDIKNVYMGIDVGSVSTNIALVDAHTERIVARYYGRTMGKPIEAIKNGLNDIYGKMGGDTNIVGVGTTGSGRKLAGVLVGADVVKNEITAHAMGAFRTDPEIDTIFEIGGQDSKYIHTQQGVPVDFEMNKVCAAGTGSFLEEQGNRLGVDIKEEFARLALNSEHPVRLGDRCTVFMESSVVAEQQKNTRIEDILAGLAYSTVFNYLHKVVGRKKIGKKISFQGGTALNRAVVAAFESVLATAIIVADHMDILGAVGIAHYAKESYKKGDYKFSRFRGIDVLLETDCMILDPYDCKDCENRCDIQQIELISRKNSREIVTWGGHCGKYDPGEHQKMRITKNYLEAEKAITSRLSDNLMVENPRGNIGIPLGLQNWYYYLFWKAFFAKLNYQVIFSEKTNNNIIKEGCETTKAEYCFPVKIFHGAVKDLLRNNNLDCIFIPGITESNNRNCPDNSFFCNYIAAEPFYLDAAFDFSNIKQKIMRPIISFREGNSAIANSLNNSLKCMDIDKAQIKAALIYAQEFMQEMTRQISECGNAALEGIAGDEAAVVLIGRPYNLYDEKMNFDVGRIFQENRIKALPMNFIDIGNIRIEEYPSMYWNYGNIILRTVKKISGWPNIYPVVLSNFKCGPDSFLSHFIKNKMGGDKPLLELEFDEHSGKAGIETRVEAFVDSIKNIKKTTPIKKGTQNKGKVASYIGKGSTRTLYIPHISRGSVLLSAAFRNFRLQSRPLDELFESGCAESLQLGLKYTSGKECFPATVTLGDILYAIQTLKMMDIDIGKEVAFFMPEAHGPCRFGQYNKYFRIVLDELGYQNVPLISLTSKDSYSGLNGLGVFNKKQFRKIGLKAIIIADYLEKMLRATRAYEVSNGHAEKVFRVAQKMMVHEIENIRIRSEGKIKAGLMKTWRHVLELFKDIPIKNEMRPMIGITGEIYMRCHEVANQGLEKAIEKFGGECYVAPISEWIMYTAYMKRWQAMHSIRKSGFNFSKVFLNDLIRALRTSVKYGIEQWYQSYQEHILHKPLNGFIDRQKDTPVHKILEYSQYYGLFDKELYGEGILSLGSIIDYAERNFGGIIVSMPFGCMPGTNVDAILPKVRKVVRQLKGRNIPILTCIDDETKQPNRELLLQLLVEQAKNDLKRQ